MVGVTRSIRLTLTVMAALFGLSTSTVLSSDLREADAQGVSSSVQLAPEVATLKVDGLADPQNTVNLYTGQHEENFPLLSLNARGLAPQTVVLKYNGNVFNIATDENRRQQASEFGLGFTLHIGTGLQSIRAEHQNTTNIDDDDYFLIQNGNAIKLIPVQQDTTGCWTCDDNPYEMMLEPPEPCTTWVSSNPPYCDSVELGHYVRYITERGDPWVVRRLIAQNGDVDEVIAWTVTLQDGTICLFGDSLSSNSQLNATRNLFRYGQFVGSGVLPDDSPFLCQWDIRRISDAECTNSIDFHYTQQKARLLVRNSAGDGTTTSAHEYTQASYLSEITTSDGQRLELTYADRSDYQPFYGVNIYEFFQKKRLDAIRQYSRSGLLQTEYRMSFGYLNWIRGYVFSKLLLDGFHQVSPSNDSLSGYSFVYDTVPQSPTVGSMLEASYPTGAIKKLHYSTVPDSANFTWLRQVADDVLDDNVWHEILPGDDAYVLRRDSLLAVGSWSGCWKVDTIIPTLYPASAQRMLDWPAVSTEGWVAFFNHDEHRAVILRNRNGSWTRKETDTIPSLPSNYNAYLYPGHECFLLLVGPASQEGDSIYMDKAYYFHFNGERWSNWCVANLYGQYYRIGHVHNDGDVFAVAYDNRDHHIQIQMHKFDPGRNKPVSLATSLMETYDFDQTDFFAGTDFIAFQLERETYGYRYDYGDGAWHQILVSAPDADFSALAPHPNGLSVTYHIPGSTEPQDRFFTSWFFTASFDTLQLLQNMYTNWEVSDLWGSDHSLVILSRRDKARVYEWNGYTWQWNHNIATSDGWNLYHSDNDHCYRYTQLLPDMYGMWGTWWEADNTEMSYLLRYAFYTGHQHWSLMMDGDAAPLRANKASCSYDRFVIQVPPYDYSDTENGNQSLYVHSPYLDEETPVKLKEHSYSVYPWRSGGVILQNDYFYTDRRWMYYPYNGPQLRTLMVHRFVRDEYRHAAPFYVVDSITTYRNPDDESPTVYTLAYWGGLLQRDAANTPRFSRTTVSTPHYLGSQEPVAYTETFFYNDIDSVAFPDSTIYDSLTVRPSLVGDSTYGVADGGYRLDGRPYMTCSYVQDDTITTDIADTARTYYSFIESPDPGYDVFVPIVDSVVSQQDGVISTVQYFYDSLNFRPVATRAEVSPQVYRVDSVTYGYTDNQNMQVANALVQVSSASTWQITYDSTLQDSVAGLLDSSSTEYSLQGSWKPATSRKYLSDQDTSLIVSTTEAWDSVGNPVLTANAFSVCSGVIYDPTSAIAVAAVENTCSKDFVYNGFEYGDGWDDWHLYLFRDGVDTVRAGAFTGNKCLRLIDVNYNDGLKVWGPGRDISADSLSDSLYLASCWIKANQTCFIYAWAMDANDSILSYNGYDYEPENSGDSAEWVRVTNIFSFQSTYGGTHDLDHIGIVLGMYDAPFDTNYAYFDDFRFHSMNSQMTTTCFDERFDAPLATSDVNNVPSKYDYDSFGRLSGEYDHQGSSISKYSYWLAMDNTERTLVPQTFYAPAYVVDTPCILGQLHVDSAQTIQWEYRLYDHCTQSSVRPQFLTSGLCIATIGPTSTTCTNDTVIYTGSLIAADSGTITVWQDFDYADSTYPPPYATLTLNVVGNSPSYDPTRPNYTLTTSYRSPMDSGMAVAFTDGFGNSTQTRILTKYYDTLAVSSVSSAEYDSRSRIYREYKPFPDTVSLADFTTYDTTYQTKCASYYSSSGRGADCDGYPFTEYAYEQSVSGRVIEVKPPGLFRSHPIQTSYGSNQSTLDGYAPNLLYEQMITDENGNVTVSYTNRLGGLIATVSDTLGTNGNLYVHTGFEKDVLGRDTIIVQPEGQKISRTYNSFNWLVRDSSGDQGVALYVYDRGGNLRFWQTATDSSLSRFHYSKYDDHDRVIEGGVVYLSSDLMTWANANLQGFPDSSSVYPGYMEITARYEYDEGEYCFGRLSKAVVAPPSTVTDTSSWEEYEYDARGNVIRKREYVYHVDVGLASRLMQGQYNNLGQITRQTYANAKYVDYSYYPDGSVAGVVDNDSILSASYIYWPNGQVKSKILGRPGLPVQTVDYRYNARDWLLTINDGRIDVPLSDDQFGLTLTYDENGYRGREDSTGWEFPSGYYNGNIASYKLLLSPGLALNDSTVQHYGYDNVSRLIAEYRDGIPFEPGSQYEYDRNGNILVTSVIQSGGNLVPTLYYNYYDSTNRLEEIVGYAAGTQNYRYTPSGSLSRDTTNHITADYTTDEQLARRSQPGEYGSFYPDQLQYWYNTGGERICKSFSYYNKITCPTDTIVPRSIENPGDDASEYPRLESGTPSADAIESEFPDTRTTDQYFKPFPQTERSLSSSPLVADKPVLPGDDRPLLGSTPSECYQNVTKYHGYYLFGGRVLSDYKGSTSYHLIANYVYVNGERIARFKNSDTVDVYYYLNDHLGSVVGVINGSDGALRNKTTYRAYGIVQSSTVNVDDDYGYTNQHLDDELDVDWYYYGKRYYEPAMMRFTSVDPAADMYLSESPYAYCSGNPLRFIDPNGEGIDDYLSTAGEWVDIAGDWLKGFGTGFWKETKGTYRSVIDLGENLKDDPIGTLEDVKDEIQHAVLHPSDFARSTHIADKWMSGASGKGEVFGFCTFAVLSGYYGSVAADELAGSASFSRFSWAEQGSEAYDDLVRTARLEYPKKAGRIEYHHRMPKYLGGAKKGPVVPIDAAYHQLITNEFRSIHPYGMLTPSRTRVLEIMDEVYTKYPLPPEF